GPKALAERIHPGAGDLGQQPGVPGLNGHPSLPETTPNRGRGELGSSGRGATSGHPLPSRHAPDPPIAAKSVLTSRAPGALSPQRGFHPDRIAPLPWRPPRAGPEVPLEGDALSESPDRR